MRLRKPRPPPWADEDRVEDKVEDKVANRVALVEDSSPTRAASLDARDALVALVANSKCCFAPKPI